MSEILKKGPDGLIPPYGGELKILLTTGDRARSLKEEAHDLPPIFLTGDRALADFELLAIGALSPLTGFMNSEDYNKVVEQGKLANGLLWPIPIVLDVSDEIARELDIGGRYALRQAEGNSLGVITVEDIYKPDKRKEALMVYGTDDPKEHPGVNYLLNQTGPIYVGGQIEAFQLPVHSTYPQYRLTPQQVRQEIAKRGLCNVVAFQTRNPTHRAHFEIMKRAMEEHNAALLFHPTVGPTKVGDVEAYARITTYIAVIQMFPDPNSVIFAILPKAMRFAGPREALLDAIIRRNYGATHIIIGRDHAGVNDIYKPFSAQQLAKYFEDELGIKIVEIPEMVYVIEEGRYIPRQEAVEKGYTPLSISGTELRRMILEGKKVPDWYSFPPVINILHRTMTPRRNVDETINMIMEELVKTGGTIQPRIEEILAQPTPEPTANDKRGVIIWMTGLSGSGKTTIARIVEEKLLQRQVEYDNQRPTTVLDGDQLRHTLSGGLGFSREDRHENVLRAAYLAARVASENEIVLCTFISPYSQSRDTAREIANKFGVGFIEVYVYADLKTVIERDPKGLYKKALESKIRNLTGIDDPYETPQNPELTIDTTRLGEEEAANLIISYLQEHGYLTI